MIQQTNGLSASFFHSMLICCRKKKKIPGEKQLCRSMGEEAGDRFVKQITTRDKALLPTKQVWPIDQWSTAPVTAMHAPTGTNVSDLRVAALPFTRRGKVIQVSSVGPYLHQRYIIRNQKYGNSQIGNPKVAIVYLIYSWLSRRRKYSEVKSTVLEHIKGV